MGLSDKRPRTCLSWNRLIFSLLLQHSTPPWNILIVRVCGDGMATAPMVNHARRKNWSTDVMSFSPTLTRSGYSAVPPVWTFLAPPLFGRPLPMVIITGTYRVQQYGVHWHHIIPSEWLPNAFDNKQKKYMRTMPGTMISCFCGLLLVCPILIHHLCLQGLQSEGCKSGVWISNSEPWGFKYRQWIFWLSLKLSTT